MGLTPSRRNFESITNEFHHYDPQKASQTASSSGKRKLTPETRLRHAQESYDRILLAVQAIEVKLQVQTRWVQTSDEYKAAETLFRHRYYQRCVDELEGLVVSRIFELTKMNMAQTGEESLWCCFTRALAVG